MTNPNVLDSEGLKNKSKEKTPKNKKKRSYRIPRLFFLSLVFIGFLGIIGFIALATTDLPPLDEIENPRSNFSTQVFSEDGVILDNFYTEENRVPVRLNDISPYVPDALIATEDVRFYSHSGVDYWSIPALIVRNLVRGTSSGASTITMQLSRNLFNAVGSSRTVNRKIKEVIVAAILEKNYTKQEIMEAYLNTVNIYSNAYGIEMAAQRLFGKPAKDLTIEESATLVAMLKGQGVFDPIRKPKNVIERRNLVINNMKQHGFLNENDAFIDSLKNLPLLTQKQGLSHLQGTAQYFREHVRKFMRNWCDNNLKEDGTPYNFYTDGLKVFTTIDQRLQKHAEAAMVAHLSELQPKFNKSIKGHEPYKYDPTIIDDLMHQSYRYIKAKNKGKSETDINKEFTTPVKMRIFSWQGEIDTTMTPKDSIKYYSQFLETGMVSIDPKNGKVKAWVGGIDFKFFKYDHVAQGTRQVGSTFKPFVYGAAMQAGYDPCTQMLNQPVTFENVDGNGESWTPKNATGEFGGLMTLRRGLATSTNLITARLMKEVTPFNVVRFARAAGIKSSLEAVPSLCLGTADLTVLEMTGAYQTFANEGVHIEPFFISRIEDKNGNVLASFGGEPNTATDKQTAFKVVELLRGVVDEGTAARLRYEYKFTNEIGGKTGTTQNHSDGWFIGVTPNLVSGVWVGCSDRRMHFPTMKNGQGAVMALPIWAKYMRSVYEDEKLDFPQDRFKRPGRYFTDFNCGEAEERRIIDPSLIDADKNKLPSSDDLDSFD
ncbi:MAG: transglycosylase domain-containing protein [Bacteroidia bacterium]|nr:transglycosylase domain-containing protein [Bacteroidia bacterium]